MSRADSRAAEDDDSMTQRLPNVGKDEGPSDNVSDVLGGSDLCYDKSGEIVTCEKKN